MFINRNYSRTEEDDFKLNVEDQLRDTKEAVPIYNNEGDLVGWRVQWKYD